MTGSPRRTDMLARRPLDRFVARTSGSRPIAAARILFGAAVLMKAWDIQENLLYLTGDRVLLIPYAGWLPSPTEPLAYALLAAWVVGGVGFTLGVATRWSAAAMTAAIAVVFVLDQQLYSNHYYLVLVLAPLFTLADTGATWSVDALRRGARETVAAWPVDLLRIQLSIVYGFAALAKLNADYLRGEVLDVYLVFLGPWEFPDALQTSTVLTGLAVGSLLVEAYLAVGFWLRGNWRWLALALGVAFHLTIVATMRARWGLTVFSLEMFALYALFFSWRRTAR
jgi:hypothetical protein